MAIKPKTEYFHSIRPIEGRVNSNIPGQASLDREAGAVNIAAQRLPAAAPRIGWPTPARRRCVHCEQVQIRVSGLASRI
jgi:hypothetical protein